jgi:hypothetical protein
MVFLVLIICHVLVRFPFERRGIDDPTYNYPSRSCNF